METHKMRSYIEILFTILTFANMDLVNIKNVCPPSPDYKDNNNNRKQMQMGSMHEQMDVKPYNNDIYYPNTYGRLRRHYSGSVKTLTALGFTALISSLSASSTDDFTL